MQSLVFWADRDNAEDVVLLEDRTVVSAAPVTRVLLEGIGTTDVDSAVTADAFEWPVVLTHQNATVDGIRFTLGGLGIAPGLYGRVRLTTFDVDNTNGIVWSEQLTIQVRG